MTDFTENQKKDITFFRENQSIFWNDESLKHKFVVISNQEIIKCFDTPEAAVDYASDNLREGEYIVQRIFDEESMINYARTATG